VLVMTGHEGDATRATAVGAATAVVLNAALIPLAGLTGAAAATVISVLARNALASYYTRARLGIDTTLAGRPAAR
jgi:O-antigen/teichoic acid export membrane protein